MALSGVRPSMMATGTARVTFLARLRPGVWLVTEDPRDPAAVGRVVDEGVGPEEGHAPMPIKLAEFPWERWEPVVSTTRLAALARIVARTPTGEPLDLWVCPSCGMVGASSGGPRSGFCDMCSNYGGW